MSIDLETATVEELIKRLKQLLPVVVVAYERPHKSEPATIYNVDWQGSTTASLGLVKHAEDRMRNTLMTGIFTRIPGDNT